MERVSDESSRRADSDSHPDNWTDSDPPPPNTSPPRNHVEEKKVSAYFTSIRAFVINTNFRLHPVTISLGVLPLGFASYILGTPRLALLVIVLKKY